MFSGFPAEKQNDRDALLTYIYMYMIMCIIIYGPLLIFMSILTTVRGRGVYTPATHGKNYGPIENSRKTKKKKNHTRIN